MMFLLKICLFAFSVCLCVSFPLSDGPADGSGNNDHCPEDWTNYPKTNKCFRVFGGEKDGVGQMKWVAAEDYCQQFNGGHLASFHSEEEITFVIEMAHKAEAHGDRMFIGLSFNALANWTWQDGSAVTYFRWWNGAEAEQNSQTNPAGFLYTRKMHTGYMGVTNGQLSHSFVCQTTTVTVTTTQAPEEGS